MSHLAISPTPSPSAPGPDAGPGKAPTTRRGPSVLCTAVLLSFLVTPATASAQQVSGGGGLGDLLEDLFDSLKEAALGELEDLVENELKESDPIDGGATAFPGFPAPVCPSPPPGAWTPPRISPVGGSSLDWDYDIDVDPQTPPLDILQGAELGPIDLAGSISCEYVSTLCDADWATVSCRLHGELAASAVLYPDDWSVHEVDVTGRLEASMDCRYEWGSIRCGAFATDEDFGVGIGISLRF